MPEAVPISGKQKVGLQKNNQIESSFNRHPETCLEERTQYVYATSVGKKVCRNSIPQNLLPRHIVLNWSKSNPLRPQTRILQ